jgi:hypothetical protein
MVSVFYHCIKTKIPKISQKARPCQTQKFSQAAQKVNFKNLSEPILFQAAVKLTANVSQIHAGRGFPDELPTKICTLNLLISSQRSNKTRLAGILLL